ncbi:uncharacterized protein TNCT_573771 [Trichonephila clavata]|uniref:Uncharacterized protein n=1 Tax=Trichonephila clavata TaxID=2740835 RepID=A0A8X6G2U9_TRICU|nr:uncharacterized protein TNCT_573771 [Trichonephila clavata]
MQRKQIKNLADPIENHDAVHKKLFSVSPNQAALDEIVARVTSKQKKETAPAENNTFNNASNVSKSLVKKETRKRATVVDDGFRLPAKKQTAKLNGKLLFLSSPAVILTVQTNNSAPPLAPLTNLSHTSEKEEDIEVDTEQTAVTPRTKIPTFFIQLKPDWTDLMVFARSLAPTLQSKLSVRFLRITVRNEDEYRKLATYFRHEQIEVNAFMLKSERPLKRVLRGDFPLPPNLKLLKKKSSRRVSKFIKLRL